MSTTPAFSPGPCTTSLPRVGKRFKCTLLDLYEQCSLHITLKMPSSVMFGSRLKIFWIRVYSSRVMPCSATISGVTLISVCAVAMCSLFLLSKTVGARCLVPRRALNLLNSLCSSRRRLCRACQRFHHRTEHHNPVFRIEHTFHRPLRMRH